MPNSHIVIAITQKEAAEAYGALSGMLKEFPPLMRRINYEGNGESDESECEKDIQLAMKAVLALIAIFEEIAAGAKMEG